MKNQLFLIIIIIIICFLLFSFSSRLKENFWVRPECRGKCHYNVLLNNPGLMEKMSNERTIYTVPYGYYDPRIKDFT